jgi:hypothetical protein
MLPFLPTSTIKDLSVEIFGGDSVTRSYTENDPDRFHHADSLEPDPVFMGLRSLVSSGPIGRLRAWIDQKLEESENRRYGYGPTASESQFHAQIVDRPGGIVIEEPRERDIAA